MIVEIVKVSNILVFLFQKGTTLPEVGEFRPYPNNPYITSKFIFEISAFENLLSNRNLG